MRNKTVGRNDPCPCGSGKKYKRCCLAENERRAAQGREPVPQLGEDAPSAAPPSSIEQISGLLQKLARKSSSRKDRAGFQELLARTQPILDYIKEQPAIDAASQAIEAHRADFDRLANDEAAYMQRTRTLFAEERFVPLRFAADDVRRAFDKAGHPTSGSSEDEFVETVRKAILHLADKERRGQLTMNLLMLLPHYVTADRPLDAWIIQHCSYLTGELTDESNPFLFEMFSYGYNSWVKEQRSREAAMLSQLGMDISRLEHMSMAEIDAWLQEQQADPAKRARMEGLLLANPEQRLQAEANLEKLERDAHKLLEREDAAPLLLSPDEIQSWLPRINESWASVCEQFPDVAAGTSPSPAVGDALVTVMFPLISEMVGAVFTQDRIQQLTARLKTYREERYAAGDKQTTAWANGAIIALREEGDPASNRFLYALGYVSLLKGLESMASQAPTPAPPPDQSAG